MSYTIDIGLEVHAQLNTKTKMFSNGATQFGQAPNTQVAPVDMGMPGTLPVINQTAIKQAILFGLSCNATISKYCEFARKNYFYPDLPKGYQISQFNHPIVSDGVLEFTDNDTNHTVRIQRAHLEEDAAKSTHETVSGKSYIDLNRSGQALLEIVTHPDLHSVTATISYLKTLHNLVKYIGICDGNMQEGSFRCDVNISLRENKQAPLGTRVEIKNLNSFKFIEKAIEYEIKRQCKRIQNNEEIIQETRLFDEVSGTTKPLRTKEDAPDYRYFPDPDLPVLIITDEDIRQIQNELPELPWEKKSRYQLEYQLSDYDAKILSHNQDIAYYFESVISQTKLERKIVANWLIVELLALSNKFQVPFKNIPIPADNFAKLLDLIHTNVINGKIAKTILSEMWESHESPEIIVDKKGLSQITNSDEINQMIRQIMEQSQPQLQAYKSGKEQLFGYFVGQVMKASKGKANPAMVNQLIKQYLGAN